jgi:hypothetical protein
MVVVSIGLFAMVRPLADFVALKLHGTAFSQREMTTTANKKGRAASAAFL